MSPRNGRKETSSIPTLKPSPRTPAVGITLADKRVFKITTPPTSTNQLKVSVKRRGVAMQIKSPAYRLWQQTARIELHKQKGFDCTHPFLWSSFIEFPCNCTGLDLDNAEKAIFDILNQLQLVPDDRYQCRKSMEWCAGNHFIVHITREPLTHWLQIKQYKTKATIKKLSRGYSI